MQITKIHFHHLRIPLRMQFAQANQNTALSNSAVVRIQTREGTLGYGESCPRTYVTGESAAQVRQTLMDWRDELMSLSFESLEQIEAWTRLQLEGGKGPAAVCAIELALIDAWCWEYQKDLLEALNVKRAVEDVTYSGVLPYGSWDKLEPVVTGFDFPSWKFKAYEDLPQNIRRIREMKALLGSETDIRLDANGGWTLTMAREHISKSLALGVSSFEQPLAPDNDAEAANLVAEFGATATIMADESLCSFADAERLIAGRQCNHFSLKLSKNGGLFNTLRIYRLAQENGIPCQLSAHYGETSILSAAGLLLATLAPDLSHCEGALGTYLLREDITKIPLMTDAKGKISPIQQAFIGWPSAIDEMRLNQYSIRTELWERKAAMV